MNTSSLLISKRDLRTLKSGRESVLVRSFPLLRSRHKNPPPSLVIKGQFTFGVTSMINYYFINTYETPFLITS